MLRTRTAWSVVVPLLCAVFFASCGGSASGSDSASKPWKGEFDTGTKVEAQLFVSPDDPQLAGFETFRKAVGAPAVVYGRVTARNESKTADRTRFLTLTDKAGKPLEEGAIIMDFLCVQASRWQLSPGVTEEALAQFTPLFQERCGGVAGGQDIAPGGTVTYLVAVQSEHPPAFERVFVGAGTELKR